MAVSKTFRLPDELVAKLQAAADLRGVSLSAHVIDVLGRDGGDAQPGTQSGPPPKPPKPTLAEAREIVSAAGLRVLTGAELKGLTVERHAAADRPAPTRANVPGREPPKDAVAVPTERTTGMSKNATVRPSLKTKRLRGFSADGGEVWG